MYSLSLSLSLSLSHTHTHTQTYMLVHTQSHKFPYLHILRNTQHGCIHRHTHRHTDTHTHTHTHRHTDENGKASGRKRKKETGRDIIDLSHTLWIIISLFSHAQWHTGGIHRPPFITHRCHQHVC